MNRIILFLLVTFCSLNLYSIDIEQIKNDMSVIEKNDISGNIIKSKANSDEDVVSMEQNSSDIDFGIQKRVVEKAPIDLTKKDLVYFTLMQDFEKSREAMNITHKAPTKMSQYALNVAKNNPNQTADSLSSDAVMEKTNTNITRFTGVCQFDATYDIADTLTVNIPCKIDNKIVLLNITLTPNNKNYELNGFPNFLMVDAFNNGSYSKRIFLDTQLSSVKNNANTSRNIATYYDSRKIEKILGVTAKEMSKSLADGTKQTFSDYQDYKTEEQVGYDNNGNVIVTSSTQKPDLITNLTYSAVEGVFRVIEKGVEMVNKESLPSLYQIVKNSIINIELYSKGE